MRYNPFSNIVLKAVSIAMAALLWLSVAGEEVVERGLRIPLELQNLPPTLEMIDPPPETIDVRVRGGSDALSRLAPGELVAVLDVDVTRPGRRIFQLSPDRVRAPFDVRVVQVSPSIVAIRFEESATRSVPVVPNIDGEPSPGYVVSGITSEPAAVQVVGPASVVSRVAEAITEPVAVTGARATVRESPRIGVPDPGVRLTTPQSARVTVNIVPAPVASVLQSVPIRLRNVAGGLSVRAVPPVARVSVRGSKEALADLLTDSVVAYVDIAGLGPGEYRLPVRTEPTRGFGVEKIDPGMVSVEIR
jgi:hypothetical protein